MTQYIATFFSHFGATRFKKLCTEQGFPAQVMPVPRTLSSSCGTCVKYSTDSNPVIGNHLQEIEQIVRITGENKYETVYQAEDL
ncbi:MAG: DUF3343 domain-containing protein [Lachnospiraceae bacterium]|nr:DUF3343 domain-containing protein [Lachnospiraceae bacterium]